MKADISKYIEQILGIVVEKTRSDVISRYC